jgi:hypothetical protein
MLDGLRRASLDRAGAWLLRADGRWRALPPTQRAVVACLLLAIGALPVLSRQYIGQTSGDIKIYFRVADAFFRGGHIYRDVSFEYPIYTLPWCLLPRLFSHDLESYRLAFGLEMWAFDAAIKAALLWYGVRVRRGLVDLVPFFVYSLGSAALGHLLLQRYDLVPVAIVVAAVFATAVGWPLASGALVALGTVTKLYPALVFPVLAAIWWRRGQGQLARYVTGAALATTPALVATAWFPWWGFASVHVDRGLQVESLAASVVWALHVAGSPASWIMVKAVNSNEVAGPVAAAVVGPARLVWVAATLAAVATATLSAWHVGSRSRASDAPVPLPHVAALALLPITAFVATNIVLSPQFMLWLVSLAAIVLFAPTSRAASDPRLFSIPPAARRAAWCIFVATMLVPTFFPSKEYGHGFGLWRTGVLLLRNVLLLYSTGCLWLAAQAMRQERGAPGAGVGSSQRQSRSAEL